ncbi:MAG: LacI family DNA-binding transcriptional regulator [Aestuariivirga sp.]
MNRKSVTRLVDVAKAAGVSRGTASNVFNNPDMVRPLLRERVEAAARTLGYLGPDPKARILRAGKFNAIGVLTQRELAVSEALRNPVYSLFLRGVAEACDEVGASLMLIPDGADGGGIRTALVDGFIFSRIEHLGLLSLAKLRRLPFAVVDVDPGPEISSVWVDSRAGAYAAAKHLLGLGHRRFGILSQQRGHGAAHLHPPGRNRPPEIAGIPMDQGKLQGYANALAEAGLDIDDVPVVQAKFDDAGAARMILDAAPEATAILSMSVMLAIALVEEARRRGISVPRDLSVVGYNDIGDAMRCDPPLTTVDARGIDKGRLAAQIVFGGGPPRHEILQPRLVIRSSTTRAP